MPDSETRARVRLQRLLAVAGVLLLAAYLRWTDIGKDPLSTDEAATSLKALGIARHAEFTLLGTSMSVGMWHSPLEVYLYALPYRLSTDPRLARIFSGVLNVIAVGLVYAVGARYFGHKAGFVAALLYAVHPEALVATRRIWKPNMGAPFVMLYVYTGLLGFYENRRWARIAHLPLLSLVVQSHPATALMTPVTAALGMFAWTRRPRHRRQMLLDNVLGAVLALALFIPWGVGLYGSLQAHSVEEILSNIGGSSRGLGYTLESLSRMLGGWRHDFSRPIQPALTVLGALWLLVMSTRSRRWFPGLVFVLALFLVPLLSLLLNAKYRDYYSWSQFPNAFLIQGTVIGTALAGAPLGRGAVGARIVGWAAIGLVAAVVWKQLSYVDDEYQIIPYTLDEHIAAIETGLTRARATGRELLALIPPPEDGSDLIWETLAEGRDLRIVWDGRAMPLPAHGAILLGPGDYTGRQAIFSDGELLFDYFRLQELPPAEFFGPELLPPVPVSLSSGATVLGFLPAECGSLPKAGQPWMVYMIWRADAPGSEVFKVFTHLLDQNGTKFAQADVPGLPVAQWRVGEQVLSQFDLQIDPGLPEVGPLYLRFGMYTDAYQASVVDAAGNAIAPYGLVQIRGPERPAQRWNNGLVLEQIATTSTVTQGPPLVVGATWRATRPLPPGLRLDWRLLTANGAAAFEASTALAGDLAPESLPPGAFVSQDYVLRIAPDLEPGEYTLSVAPEAPGTPETQPYVMPLEIRARARAFELGVIEQRVEAQFGEQLELAGYDLNQVGTTVDLVFHWRPLRRIMTDYKYFVHVWRDGQLVAQLDTMPADYAYPTSWWAPGEVFSDRASLDLSALGPGEYMLTVGLYDPQTDERLPVMLADGTPASEGFVTLQSITLGSGT